MQALLGCLVVMSCHHAWALTGEDCGRIENQNARLICYDRLFRVVTKSSAADVPPLALSIAAEPELVGTEPVTPVDLQNNFGQERIDRTEQRKVELKELSSTVVKLEKRLRGQYQFTLDNGQIWQQIEAERRQFRSNTEVIIRKAAFGSYWLDAGKQGVTKVKRIQ